jgi:hypothetical protein
MIEQMADLRVVKAVGPFVLQVIDRRPHCSLAAGLK